MTYQLQIMSGETEAVYGDFILRSPETLLYASLPYKNLIQQFAGAEPHYFLAMKGGEIIGALPSFILRSEAGNVLNSLPFYGSNGGVICEAGKKDVREFLVKAFAAYAEKENCISSTIISSPLETDLSAYEKTSLTDSRIGQLTPVPVVKGDADETIMAFLDSKNRNMVRKAQKAGVVVSSEVWDGDFDFLMHTHADNLHDIGGIAKPPEFFELVRKNFVQGADYKIFTARLDGVPIAALLIFYFNKTSEYFTPVIVKEHRSLQPMSLIIFEAMKDAATRHYTWWNWGGTWQSQSGVYQFKKSWGALDKPYYYYTQIADQSLLDNSREYFLNNFPFFFVVPFDQLRSEAKVAS